MTLVERLVQCYSPSGHEKDAVALFMNELKKRGFQVYSDEVGNAIGKIGQGSARVYFVGHIDTVPGEIPVRIEDGQLYSRGSVDAKGSLAAFAEAASEFAESKTLCITVIGCVREETDSLGAQHILRTHKVPDYIVIGEPSGWEGLTLGYKGSLWLNYSLTKPRYHHGSQNQTPAEEAVVFYQTLCNSYSNYGTGFKNISIRLIDFNTSSSEHHETVEMRLNVRTPVDFDYDAFRADVARLRGEASVEVKEYIPAVLADKRNVLLRSFLNAIRAQGGKPCFKYKTGTSDMNLLNTWDCPILAYGPGDSSLDHTENEHLHLDEYKRSIMVLQQALRKLETSVNEG